MTLSGTAKRPKGEKGSIFAAAPYGWKPVDYEELFVAKDGRDESLIIRKDIDFRDTDLIKWNIEFARLTDKERSWRKKGK